MKKVAVAAGMLAAVLWASPALAGHGSTSESGTISYPNPASAVIGGVTENLAPCSPNDDLQGFDGYWIDIGGFEGHTARISTGDADADFDGWFYDASCTWIEDYTLNETTLGQDEVGTIPPGATWIVVDLFLSGGESSFSFTAS